VEQGGARAASGGRVSAFITSKCVLSIVRFAHAQEQTALFIDSLCAFAEQWHRLEANEILGPYKAEEKQRLRYNCYVALHRYGKTLAVPFKKPSSPENMDDYVSDTLGDLNDIVKRVNDTFAEAVADVDHFRIIEQDDLNTGEASDKELKQIRFDRSTFAHERAKSALKKGFLIAKEVCEFVEHDPPPERIDVLKKISSELGVATREVRKMLEPSQDFLPVC
jgi:hypothetical protein